MNCRALEKQRESPMSVTNDNGDQGLDAFEGGQLLGLLAIAVLGGDRFHFSGRFRTLGLQFLHLRQVHVQGLSIASLRELQSTEPVPVLHRPRTSTVVGDAPAQEKLQHPLLANAKVSSQRLVHAKVVANRFVLLRGNMDPGELSGTQGRGQAVSVASIGLDAIDASLRGISPGAASTTATPIALSCRYRPNPKHPAS